MDRIGHGVRVELIAAWIAIRDPRTPMAAKAVGWIATAYAFSPIDLIPDFIPVLGLIDDVMIVPAALWLFRSLIPAPLLAEFRAEAETRIAEQAESPRSRGGILIVLAIWAVLLWLLYHAIRVSEYH